MSTFATESLGKQTADTMSESLLWAAEVLLPEQKKQTEKYMYFQNNQQKTGFRVFSSRRNTMKYKRYIKL